MIRLLCIKRSMIDFQEILPSCNAVCDDIVGAFNAYLVPSKSHIALIDLRACRPCNSYAHRCYNKGAMKSMKRAATFGYTARAIRID